MKGISVSFEAANVQSAARNWNTRSAFFARRLLIIGLWVFAGYYLGCKVGFALTFQPHPISVLLPLCGVHRPVLVVVFRRRACRMEPLGRGHLLGADPSTPFFDRLGAIDRCAVSRDMGDDWNSAPADSPTIALLGGMRAIYWSVARKLRCPLQIRIGNGLGSSLSPAPIPSLGGGTIRLCGSKHCYFDCQLPGDLERS